MALGIFPRASALGLAAPLLPTTLVGHVFWDADDGTKIQHVLHFSKNSAFAGGLVYIATRDEKEAKASLNRVGSDGR